MRMTPRKQLRATRNDTGNEIAAIKMQPNALCMMPPPY
jgi:hypothetical protein